MIFGIKKTKNDVLLAIATNIPMLLLTGFVVQGHIYILLYIYIIYLYII